MCCGSLLVYVAEVNSVDVVFEYSNMRLLYVFFYVEKCMILMEKKTFSSTLNLIGVQGFEKVVSCKET